MLTKNPKPLGLLSGLVEQVLAYQTNRLRIDPRPGQMVPEKIATTRWSHERKFESRRGEANEKESVHGSKMGPPSREDDRFQQEGPTKESTREDKGVATRNGEGKVSRRPRNGRSSAQKIRRYATCINYVGQFSKSPTSIQGRFC